jgi:hypothetical protein
MNDIESQKLKEELINLYLKIKINKETDVIQKLMFNNI